MGFIGKITDTSGNTHPIASSLYGTCDTAKDTAAKVATVPGLDKLYEGLTFKVAFKNANDQSNVTLKVNDLPAKPLYGRTNDNMVILTPLKWRTGAILSITVQTYQAGSPTPTTHYNYVINDYVYSHDTVVTGVSAHESQPKILVDCVDTFDNGARIERQDTVSINGLPANLSDLADDSDHRTVSDAEKASWDAKSNFSGSYNDLTNKPNFATVATSGSYNDLSNKPSIPSVDNTLAVSGAAADSKTTGDAVTSLRSALSEFNPSEIKIGINLFDGQTTANKQVQSNSIADASGFYVSKPIYLTKGTYVYAVRYNSYVSNAPYYAITDENGNKLSIGTATQTAVSYTIGSTTLVFYKLTLTDYCHVVFNVGASASQVSITMVSKINTDDDIPTGFIPYNDEIYVLKDSVSLNAEMLADIERQVGVSLKKNTNIFDGTFQTTEQYIKESGYQAATNYFVNAPIWINKGEKIAFINRTDSYGANSGRYIIVNSDNTQILYNAIATDTTETITIGSTTYKWYSLEIVTDGYYVFNAGVGNQKKDFMVFSYASLADLPSGYVAYNGRKVLDEDVYPNTYIMNLVANNLTGKKISLNGDSICAGVGYAGGYGKIIADENGMDYQNIGVGGGTIASNTYSGETPRYWISQHISDMDSDADYVVLEGGVNDASLQVTLGSLTSDFYSTNVYDATTFYGGLEYMFNAAYARFSGKKICFIIPHQCSGRMKPGQPYYNAIMETCSKWGIPVCDLSIECPPFGFFRENTPLNQLKLDYTKDGDGWHPNEQGYKKYYVNKITDFLKSL